MFGAPPPQAATAREGSKEGGGAKTSFAPPHNDVRFRKPSPPLPNDHVGRIATVRQKIMSLRQMPAAWRELLYECDKKARCREIISVKMPCALFKCGTPAPRAGGSILAGRTAAFGVVGSRFCRIALVGTVFEPFENRSSSAALTSQTRPTTIPGDGRSTWTGTALRESAAAQLFPRVLRALLAVAALSNNRAAALLRFAAALTGSRGASCAGLWSAHVAGMVPRQFKGDDQWQLSAL